MEHADRGVRATSRPAGFSPIVVDGSLDDLDSILGAIADLDAQLAHLEDARAAAHRAALDYMRASGVKERALTLRHLHYVAAVETVPRTYCVCHDVEPWRCEDRFVRPIALVEQREPMVKVKLLCPPSGRYDGDANSSATSEDYFVESPL